MSENNIDLQGLFHECLQTHADVIKRTLKICVLHKLQFFLFLDSLKIRRFIRFFRTGTSSRQISAYLYDKKIKINNRLK